MAVSLSIVTPGAPVVDGVAVDDVVAPGSEGEFGVLQGHESYLAPLSPGVVRYRSEGREHRVAISGGFAEVLAERVTILAQTAEPAESIDLARAEAARERAREALSRLGSLASPEELDAERERLARAEARVAASQT